MGGRFVEGRSVEGRSVEGRLVGRTFCSEGRFVEGRFVLVPLKQNVFGIGIFPGKNQFSNTARIRLLLNTAQSQIEPCLSNCL